MMKKIFLLGLTATVFMFTSCENYKEVKQFAADFADVIKGGDRAKIIELYPDLGESDSLSVAFNADSVSVEETEVENQFVVQLNSNQSMTVEKNEEGKFHVLKSKGLFVFAPELMEFCKALGCYDTTLCDKENAERMRDPVFVDYLNEKAGEIIKNKVHVKQNIYYTDYYIGKVDVAISNETGFDLPKGSYVVKAKEYFQGDGPAFLQSIHEYSEDIAKGEIGHYIVPVTIDDLTRVEASLEVKRVDMDMLQKIYRPTGNEYQDYLNSPLYAEFHGDGSGKHMGNSHKGGNGLYDSVLKRKLTEDDLNGLSKEDLRKLRNAIYAAHGYIFKDKKLLEFFKTFDWYKETTTDMNAVSAELNDVEKYNVNFIKERE